MKLPPFSLRSLLLLVFLLAVLCCAYWVGWPWWVGSKDQQQFIASVKQVKAGQTLGELEQSLVMFP
jgi:hypothetical protein